jgi:hypothetical protein
VSIAKLSLAETAILHTEKPLTTGFSAGWPASASIHHSCNQIFRCSSKYRSHQRPVGPSL